MENFIEKLKGVDKKVWIGVGIGAAVIIILIIALVIGLGGKKPTGGNNSQNGTQAGTQTEGNGSEVFGTEDVTETIGTEMGTEIGTEMGTETTESESQTQGTGGTTVTQRPDVNGVTQQPVTTTPDGQEMLGDGTAKSPYMPLPNSSMAYTTIAIPAGQTVYYSFRGAGGMWMSISDSDAFVIESNGKRHNASGGKVGFTVESAMASDYVTFQIGNSGSTAKSFTIKFSNIKGTQANPEEITTLADEISLNKGDADGWFYRYKATQSGTIRFYIDSQTKPSTLRVTKNSTSATVQRDSEGDIQTDENGNNYFELEVSANDVIIIEVHAKPDSKFNYPATTVKWHGEYAQ